MEFKGYSSLWKAIIRPPRCEYEIKELGPSEFNINGVGIVRTDFEIKNIHGFTL